MHAREKHRRNLQVKIDIMRAMGRSDEDIAEAILKAARFLNPFSEAEAKKLLADNGISPVSADIIHTIIY